MNAEAAKNLYAKLDLSALYSYNTRDYATTVLYIIFLSALKAYICYLVIKVFLKINLAQPFSIDVSKLISGISYVALGIGALALLASVYIEWLTKKGVTMPNVQHYTGGAGEHLFFGGIIFIISLVFKRGIEIQTENELTV